MDMTVAQVMETWKKFVESKGGRRQLNNNILAEWPEYLRMRKRQLSFRYDG